MHSEYDEKRAGMYSQDIFSDDPRLTKTLSKSTWYYQGRAGEQQTLYTAVSQDVRGMDWFNRLPFKALNEQAEANGISRGQGWSDMEVGV